MENDVRKPVKVIDIPDGCIAKISNGKVVFYKRLHRRVPDGVYRCKDCANRVRGRCTYNGSESSVCKMRPKEIGEYIKRIGYYVKQELYYHAGMYDKICDKFKLK